VTAVFRLAGVDYVQWKAVTRTLLKTDFRLPLADDASMFGRASGLLTMALVLSLFGLGAAVLVVVSRDVLLTGTVALTYLSVMLVSTLLTQHGMTLLSTADYVILGSRPVSSRTFLAIRVTNVLFHALVVTSLMAYPVVLAYVFAGEVNVVRGAAATTAIYAWAIALTLAILASYGTVLRVLGAARFRRAIGYLQLIGGFMGYGGLLLASRALGNRDFANVSAPDAWWLIAIPPAWFASYLEIAVGSSNSTTLVRALLSIASLGAIALILRGKLGLEYARHLADLPLDSSAAATVRTPLFASGEARAVAILVVAHFRRDLRVRMGILAIVPLIVLYFLIGSRDDGFDLVAMAVLLFPAVLTRHFTASDTHHASWLFRATPTDSARVIIALKNIAVGYFLLPFLLLVTMVFAWRMNDIVRALLHTAVLGLLSHLALQSAIFVSPRLPFSRPPDKTTGSASLIVWMFFVILGGQAALWALDRWVYVTHARTMVLILALLAASWGCNRAIAWRVRFTGSQVHRFTGSQVHGLRDR
jgi:hypothetical protein